MATLTATPTTGPATATPTTEPIATATPTATVTVEQAERLFLPMLLRSPQ